jgi:hypothetical protein
MPSRNEEQRKSVATGGTHVEARRKLLLLAAAMMMMYVQVFLSPFSLLLFFSILVSGVFEPKYYEISLQTKS